MITKLTLSNLLLCEKLKASAQNVDHACWVTVDTDEGTTNVPSRKFIVLC